MGEFVTIRLLVAGQRLALARADHRALRSSAFDQSPADTLILYVRGQLSQNVIIAFSGNYGFQNDATTSSAVIFPASRRLEMFPATSSARVPFDTYGPRRGEASKDRRVAAVYGDTKEGPSRYSMSRDLIGRLTPPSPPFPFTSEKEKKNVS